MNGRSLISKLCNIAAVSAAVVGATDSYGQTSAVATGNWSNGATWSAGEPNGTTPALINGGFTVTIDQAGETGNQVDLGTIAGESGSINVTGGDLTVSNANPANFPSTIRLGQVAGSTGNLTMSGGTVAINGNDGTGFAIADILIGDNGAGTMTMTGGTFTAADEAFIALGGTSTGTLSVSGGTFNVAGRNLLVAFFGGANGTFNLSGTGVVNVDEFLFSSFNDGTTSTINQTGGTLNVGGALVHGRRGNAAYNHSAGAVNVTTAQNNGDFVVGDGGPNNSYNISGSAAASAGRNFLVGVFGDAVGTVNQSGGTITVGNLLRVGIDGLGNWNQTGGTTTVAGSAFLGDFDTSLGTYKSSGGVINITGNLSVGGALASNAPPMPVDTQGQALDADGTLVISGSGGDVNIAGNLLANPGDHTRRRPDMTGDNVSNLIFEILDGTGVSRVDVGGIADLTGTLVDVDVLGGAFSPGATFDLITAASIGSNYGQVAEDVGRISLAIVSGRNGQILRATLIPEPAAFVMAAAAALALVVGQRRFAG